MGLGPLALCTESSDLLGRASYCVGAFASQYSCVLEPLPDFTRGGRGGEGEGEGNRLAPSERHCPSIFAFILALSSPE